MSTPFDRVLYGFRFATVNFNDTLQKIAYRELDDASRWVELISYNKLVPPFIVNDEADRVPGVLVAGDQLLVPAPSPAADTTINPDEVFQVDMALTSRGMLKIGEDGDFEVVGGSANLQQALKNAIETDRGELLFHSRYGSRMRQLIGKVNGPTAALLAAQYARSAAEDDPRISRIRSATATVDGEVVRASVIAEAINGREIKTEAQR
jgi:phage baseplate assembly protein W